MVLALGWPILFSGRAPLWCGLTALSCSACLISRGFAPGWHGSGLRPASSGADCRCSYMSAEGAAYQPACAIRLSGRAPLWCGLTALSCSACLISRGFAPGWHGSGIRPSSNGADCRCSCMSAEGAGHISRRAQSGCQVGRHYGAGLQPFLVLPVSFPGASPRAVGIGLGLRPSSNGADCRCSCMSAEGAGHISRRAQSGCQVGRRYGAGLQPFLVLPVSFPWA